MNCRINLNIPFAGLKDIKLKNAAEPGRKKGTAQYKVSGALVKPTCNNFTKKERYNQIKQMLLCLVKRESIVRLLLNEEKLLEKIDIEKYETGQYDLLANFGIELKLIEKYLSKDAMSYLRKETLKIRNKNLFSCLICGNKSIGVSGALCVNCMRWMHRDCLQKQGIKYNKNLEETFLCISCLKQK